MGDSECIINAVEAENVTLNVCFDNRVTETQEHMKRWTYMSKRPDVTHSMRTILVDWLVEVA